MINRFKEYKGELGFTGLNKTKGEPGLTCLKKTREN